MKRFLAGTSAVTAMMLALTMFVFASYASAATDTVTVNGQTRTTNGTDVYRAANFLVRYTPAYGASTGTNSYGAEAVVVGGTVTQLQNGVGNIAIPSNGYVLSGHGTSRTWLLANATVGKTVTLNGTEPPPPSGGSQLLPDVGIRTLRQFQIVNTGGHKLLKFPGVTANVGAGPLEVNATRSSSTSDDWVGRQSVKTTSGGWEVLAPNTMQFYFGGDGHNHWHMRDFDAYELFDPNGKKLADGEKHGFCFEDNTQYRNWPGNPKFPAAPQNPVYTHENMCGFNNTTATTVKHGLSVGWADTYPATLPDQAIDITGLPDGIYVVKITADQGGWIKETNESNNSATGRIQITGNSVTLLQANDGL